MFSQKGQTPLEYLLIIVVVLVVIMLVAYWFITEGERVRCEAGKVDPVICGMTVCDPINGNADCTKVDACGSGSCKTVSVICKADVGPWSPTLNRRMGLCEIQ